MFITSEFPVKVISVEWHSFDALPPGARHLRHRDSGVASTKHGGWQGTRVVGWTAVSPSRQAKRRGSGTRASRIRDYLGAPGRAPTASEGRGSAPTAPSGSGPPSHRTSIRPRQARAPPALDAHTLRSSALVRTLLASIRWTGCNADPLTALRAGPSREWAKTLNGHLQDWSISPTRSTVEPAPLRTE
jgi:hypothetical protein